MKARDVMVASVITTHPHATIKEVAKTLLEQRVSALPVVDEHDRLVGMISEGDLLHRKESGTERRRSWWLQVLVGDRGMASDYIRANSPKVADVMTRDVVTASPETPLKDIANLLEKHAIKRVPIMENGQLVGIVSRANLVQAVATAGNHLDIPVSDGIIRAKLLAHLKAQPWAHIDLLNVTVSDGVVDLWGIVSSETERHAICVAAQNTPGVSAVNDGMRASPTRHAA